MAVKKSIEEWVIKAKTTHADKYAYPTEDWFDFKSKSKVPIVCPSHGLFFQSMSNHTHSTKPTGCPVCSGRKQLTLGQRVIQSKKVHGDKYDYSMWPTNVNAKTIVTTICKICGNSWEHNIDNHVRGKGCPNCKSYKSNKDKIAKAEDVMSRKIRKCKSIIDEKGDKNKYDYSVLPEFFKIKSVYQFKCKSHGLFLTTPYNHFVKGSKCPSCVNEELKNKHTFGFEKWVRLLKTVHNDYTFREYEKGSNCAKDKIYVTCKEHGEWLTSIDSMKSSGCPACKGYSQKYLYVNLVDNGVLKYGIASDMTKRLSQQNRVNSLKMRKLLYFVFDNHSDCRICESEIKNIVKPVLTKKDMTDGWTETCSSRNLELIISMCEKYGGRLNG